MVLPFRVLRPDPETDFLAFSLPDAIATSLSGIGSLIVRSSATAARFAGEAPDLKALAAEADVDRVVMGTLLRSGDQLRADGAARRGAGRHAAHVAHRPVVAGRSVPPAGRHRPARRGGAVAAAERRTPSPTPDAPHDARAYELYLRANELARTYDGLAGGARPVPALPGAGSRLRPRVGPARPLPPRDRQVHRRPRRTARRAPRKRSAARSSSTRACRWRTSSTRTSKRTSASRSAALVRLLGEAKRHGNDPELFAGLVHACRYCGLYEQSIAAHAEARRLDPNVPTSLEQTLLMTGDIDRLVANQPPAVIAGADDGIRVIGLGLAGRRDEAKLLLQSMRRTQRIPLFETWMDYLTAWLNREMPDMVSRSASRDGLKIQDDPEAMFQEGWLFCDLGEHERGLVMLQRAITKGYFVAPTLARAPQFDVLRGRRDFIALMAEAEANRSRALDAFRQSGGEQLLGA